MKEFYQKYKLLLPTLILTGFSIYTLLCNLLDGLILTLYHNLGFSACGLCLLTFFTAPKRYKYFLGITLILGTFNFLNFTPAQITQSFNIDNLGVSFQPLSLLIGILTLLLLIGKRKDLVAVSSAPGATTPENEYAQSIEKFRVKFSDKTDIELQELIADKRFTAAAKEAAQQLLSVRQDQPKE